MTLARIRDIKGHFSTALARLITPR